MDLLVVTGTSSGIGVATAVSFGRAGDTCQTSRFTTRLIERKLTDINGEIVIAPRSP